MARCTLANRAPPRGSGFLLVTNVLLQWRIPNSSQPPERGRRVRAQGGGSVARQACLPGCRRAPRLSPRVFLEHECLSCVCICVRGSTGANRSTPRQHSWALYTRGRDLSHPLRPRPELPTDAPPQHHGSQRRTASSPGLAPTPGPPRPQGPGTQGERAACCSRPGHTGAPDSTCSARSARHVLPPTPHPPASPASQPGRRPGHLGAARFPDGMRQPQVPGATKPACLHLEARPTWL